MKMSIAWHENCLKNMKASLEHYISKLAFAQKEVDRSKKDIYILEDQIRIAKQKGKDGFDSEKFLQKRKTK